MTVVVKTKMNEGCWCRKTFSSFCFM